MIITKLILWPFLYISQIRISILLEFCTVLSQLACIFDPLSFLTPLALIFKTLLQQLWISGIGWMILLRITLFLFETNFLINSCQMQIFLVTLSQIILPLLSLLYSQYDSSISVYFLSAKSRVVPVKNLSISPLELFGPLLLSKLIKYVLQTIQSQVHIKGFPHGQIPPLFSLGYIHRLKNGPHLRQIELLKSMTFPVPFGNKFECIITLQISVKLQISVVFGNPKITSLSCYW